MPTATINRETRMSESLVTPVADKSLNWLLVLPLMFFACHGVFSFQSLGTAVGGFSPGTPVSAKDPGFFGYVVMPAVAYGIVLWQMKKIWRRIAAYVSHFKLLTALALLTILSSIWSQNPLRSLSFGLFYLVGTLFVYYLVIRFEPSEIMTMVTRAGIALCVLSAIMAVAFPQYGVSTDVRSANSWQGIFYDKTTAAKALVFMLSPALVSRVTKSLKHQALIIALFLFIIVKTHAVTGYVVLFLFVIFLGCLRFGRRLGTKLSLVFIVCVAIGSVGLGIWGFEYLPDLLQSMGRDPTLTGRTGIWKLVLTSIAKRPLLGYGFYSFWTGLKGESGNINYAANWSFGYAHNGTLEILLQLGIVGAVLFYATMVQGLRNAWYCFRHDRSRRNDWFFSLLFLTLVYNLDEASVLLPNELLSMLYIVACAGLGQSAQRIKNASKRVPAPPATPRYVVAQQPADVLSM